MANQAHYTPIGPASSERRRAGRERVSISAYVRGADRHVHVPCEIVDLSAGGARVKLATSKGKPQAPHALPNGVVLTLILDQVEVPADIRWESGGEFGMQFSAGFRRVKSIRRLNAH